MGPLFWWNLWNALAFVAVAGIVVLVVMWARRGRRHTESTQRPPADDDGNP